MVAETKNGTISTTIENGLYWCAIAQWQKYGDLPLTPMIRGKDIPDAQSRSQPCSKLPEQPREGFSLVLSQGRQAYSSLFGKHPARMNRSPAHAGAAMRNFTLRVIMQEGQMLALSLD
ncbi:hypothetical protein JK182_09485 [Acetobacter okinawensis]|nr:hypothetical protein [Acetobacter okinawensis]